MKNKDEKLNQIFLVKTGFIGFLVLLLFMAAMPANAHQVIEKAIPDSDAEYVFGVKYRSFANTSEQEAIIGPTLLGSSNPGTGDIIWSKEQKNFFKFTYDPLIREISTVVFRMDHLQVLYLYLHNSSRHFEAESPDNDED